MSYMRPFKLFQRAIARDNPAPRSIGIDAGLGWVGVSKSDIENRNATLVGGSKLKKYLENVKELVDREWKSGEFSTIFIGFSFPPTEQPLTIYTSQKDMFDDFEYEGFVKGEFVDSFIQEFFVGKYANTHYTIFDEYGTSG